METLRYDPEQAAAAVGAAESARCAAVTKLCSDAGKPHLMIRLIQAGTSVDDARAVLAGKLPVPAPKSNAKAPSAAAIYAARADARRASAACAPAESENEQGEDQGSDREKIEAIAAGTYQRRNREYTANTANARRR